MAENTDPQTTDVPAENTDPQTTDVTVDEFNRDQLESLAIEDGLLSAAKYANKSILVQAINRVRSGEEAQLVDAEYAPTKQAETNPDGDGKTYQVNVVRGFMQITSAGYRHRAGLAIPVSDEGYIGPLTKDQLLAIKYDTYLTVKPHKG